MTRRPVVDESSISEFVGKMIEAHQRRLEARTVTEKRAIEREMEGFMRTYLERGAWDAMADAERHADVIVSRDTSSDRRCHGKDAQSMHTVEGKVAAAGRDD